MKRVLGLCLLSLILWCGSVSLVDALVCPKGHEIRRGWKYCPMCGSEMNHNPEKAKKGKEIGESLVLNPSFEEEEKPNKPVGWWFCRFRKGSKISSKGSHVKDKEIAHSGDYCVMIEGKGMAAWIIRSRIKVKGNATYEFSAWVKSDGVEGKGYNIEALEFVEDKHTKTRSSKFSNAPSDWQKVTIRFTTIPTITELGLRLYCYGVGKVWFDDVSLTEITE